MNMRWEGGQHWSGREEWEKCKWGWGCSQKFGYSIRKQEICKSFLSIGESLVGLRRKSYVFNMGESTGSTCVNVCERSPIRGFVCGYGYLGIFAFMFSWWKQNGLDQWTQKNLCLSALYLVMQGWHRSSKNRDDFPATTRDAKTWVDLGELRPGDSPWAHFEGGEVADELCWGRVPELSWAGWLSAWRGPEEQEWTMCLWACSLSCPVNSLPPGKEGPEERKWGVNTKRLHGHSQPGSSPKI